MNNHYHPKDIAAISVPVTARNHRNARNRPVINLGSCTPSQMLSYGGFKNNGAICVLGNPARGIGIAKAIIRRYQKPFLLIGPAADKESAFTVLEPEWIIDSAQAVLPLGNGAVLFTKPYTSYLELCEFFEEWSRDYFLLLHLSGGIQAGPEILNLLSSSGQCLIFCDSVPQSLRSNESHSITPKEFLSQMSYLIVFSSGVVTKDLIELLPTYQYERISNSMNFNSFKSRSIFHPFHSHIGHGISWSQTRTMEYKKSLFEIDELQAIYNKGLSLLYDAITNTVFLTRII